jgi:2-keto-4-pentenoate hydratase/2-oxohepta-3-ene-1,7-dioic acid hydratase in catechol pathway
MKIARIRHASLAETYAIVSDDGKKLITRSEIQDQTGIPIPSSIKEFMFKGWLEEVKEHQRKLEYVHKVEEVELLAPLPNPPKIICLAFNYYDHAKDAGLTPSDEPVIFMKPRTTLNSPYSDIICPSFVKRLDYEAEIAAIIGKDTKKASIDQSVDSIFGYLVMHDVSARDIQFKDKQFTRGKSIDTFAPCVHGLQRKTRSAIHKS